MAKRFDKVAGENFDGELCPKAQTIVQNFENPDDPPIEQMDIQAAREGHALEDYDLPIPTSAMDIKTRLIKMNGRTIRVRIYTPSGEGPFPILVFAHGGCWTFCSIDSHDRLCRAYTDLVRCIVVSVDYALAPEAPFPQGLNDFYDTVIWCFEQSTEINGDPRRVAVAGDSAGGNLSAAAAQRLQKHPAHRLSLQILIYPICDASDFEGASMKRYANGYFFTRDTLVWTASLYSKDSDLQHPEISPLHGEISESLAPAHFIIAECDVLRDQAIDYAQKLRTAGVNVQCNYYQGVPHAFVAMAGTLDLGREAIQDSANSLKMAFSLKTDYEQSQPPLS